MKYPVVVVPFLPVIGMALFPFILIKHRKNVQNKILINHELIHLRQQLELFIIPFFIIYVLNYFANLVTFRNHEKAYLLILFEKEAYLNDRNLSYLKDRKLWVWTKYFNNQHSN